ncbi:MAG: hypothetical protein ACOY5C_05530 [Pseudomonadota bacterium]|uniref:hypothetical protein n=1 Tax=Thermithiobacillus tepidarius TaxID=929 RepID=UPI000427923B|nr:hypothetical protein [Thermithiobacillus tepidarius]
MKKIALAVLLAGTSSMAFAAPTELTEAQMDQVSAGALVNIVVADLVDVNYAMATATNIAALNFGPVSQYAGAGNIQKNISYNWISQGGLVPVAQ